MKRKAMILTVALATMAVAATAAPRTKGQMKEAAAKAINEQRLKMRMAPKKASELKTLKSEAGYEIIGMESGYFAVIATDDAAPAVLGGSGKRYNAGNTNFQWWLKAINLYF